MPASFEAYDAARSTITPIRGEDAVLLAPLQPRRVLRDVFQALLAYGGLSRETRRHLLHAFRSSLEPPLERRVLAALSERWDGETARGLSEALADIAWEPVLDDDADPDITTVVTVSDGDLDVAAV